MHNDVGSANYCSSLIDKCQWIILCGIFLPNRIEGSLLLIVTFLLCSSHKKVMSSNIVKYMILVYFTSFLTITLNGYQYDKYVQQIVVLSIFIIGYEQFFKYNKRNIVTIFQKYIKACLWIAIIGFIQEVIYFLIQINVMEFLSEDFGTQAFSSRLIRITSTTIEGGYLGTVLVPCLLYLFYFNDPYKLLNGKKYLILFVSLFTISPFVYILMSLIFLVKFIKHFQYAKPILITIAVACIVYSGIVIQNKDIEKDSGVSGILIRIKDSFQVMQMMSANDIYRIAELNTSTATLATNMYIGFNAPSRIFGTGLGTNPQNHQRLIAGTFDDRYIFASLNADDGYSLFNRILSELGIVGLVLYLIFLYKNYNGKNDINKCIFLILLCWFARGGNYVLYGTIFYHFMYYYTSKFNLSFSNGKTNINNYRNI